MTPRTKKRFSPMLKLGLVVCLLQLVGCDNLLSSFQKDAQEDQIEIGDTSPSEIAEVVDLPRLAWDWRAHNPEGWTFSRTNHEVTWPAGGGIGIRTPVGVDEPDVHLRSAPLSFAGADYPKVVVDLECTENCILEPERIELMLYYTTANHGETINFSGLPSDVTPLAQGERRKLIYDMANQARGGPDWIQSGITQIRFDLPRGPNAAYIVRSLKVCHKSELDC